MQSDKDLKKLPERGKRRALPADRRARAKMKEQMGREPTPAELEADRRYWAENPSLFKG
jgi:hypothetical protein